VVGQGDSLHFGMGIQGHQEEEFRRDVVFYPFDEGIIHAVAAFIMIEGCFDGFPAG